MNISLEIPQTRAGASIFPVIHWLVALVSALTAPPAFAQKIMRPGPSKDVPITLGMLVLFLVIYLIPSVVAFRRSHPNRWAITLVNVFLGGAGQDWDGSEPSYGPSLPFTARTFPAAPMAANPGSIFMQTILSPCQWSRTRQFHRLLRPRHCQLSRRPQMVTLSTALNG